MPRGHLGAHVLYGLETADKATKLFALASIIDSLFDHGTACAKTVGGEDHTPRSAQPGHGSSPIIIQWFRFGPVKPQFPDAAGPIDGRQRDSLQARRLGTDKVQPAAGIGDDEGIGSFEIECEQGGAVELPGSRGNPAPSRTSIVSEIATPIRASPLAIFGSQWAFCSSLPASLRAIGDRT